MKRRMRWDSRDSLIAIPKMRTDPQLTDAADLHADDAALQTRDDFATPDPEGRGAGAELLASVQPASPFHGDDGSGLGDGSRSYAHVLDSQTLGNADAHRLPLSLAYFASAFVKNSNNAFVAGSSGWPRLALILEWVVSGAANTVTAIPDSLRTLPNRVGCAVVSGWPAT